MIQMIKWIRTSRLSIKNSLSLHLEGPTVLVPTVFVPTVLVTTVLITIIPGRHLCKTFATAL